MWKGWALIENFAAEICRHLTLYTYLINIYLLPPAAEICRDHHDDDHHHHHHDDDHHHW